LRLVISNRSFNIHHCIFLLKLLNYDWYLIGGIKDAMHNEPDAAERKTSRHEIVFKRESYFSDAAAHFIVLIVIAVGFIYFLDSEFVTYVYVIALIAAVVWILAVISLWQDYRTSIIVDENDITEKYLTGGGWSYKWSEISEWNALLVGDGDREIRFTKPGSAPKTHTLPSEKIGKDHYRYLKDIFIEHCGQPTKIDSWTLANAPDDE
jgi:hypothetical protein